MKGLYKRGRIYWTALRVDGKLYRESTGTTSQEEAEYILVAVENKSGMGK